ncbi:hypothetical protein Syun_029537 [Stephania yunnanensis]|uniref:Uncharacterized protein n=1 Tax=Stephania yunnanensis TaxID=152371 RepID=A0AAP0EDD2_9MAGN
MSRQEVHAALINFEAKLLKIQETKNKMSSLTITAAANAAFVKNQGFVNKFGENQYRASRGGSNSDG